MSWRLGVWCAAVALATVTPVWAETPPRAFKLLEDVRSAYTEIDTYSDLGELEITRQGNTTLYFFETSTDADGRFLFRIHGENNGAFDERVVWRDGESSFVYSSLLKQYRSLPSVVSELAHGWGPGTYDALAVPLLLAGAGDALGDPQAASIVGQEPCGQSTCWLVSLFRMAGAIEIELRIDQDSKLIREVVAWVESPGAFLRPKGKPDNADLLTIRARHTPTSAIPSTFKPPTGTRQVAEFEIPPSKDGTSVAEPRLGATFKDEITVSWVEVVARIVDSKGEPIRDLSPKDLLVRVGKTQAPVASLEWHSSYGDSVSSQGADFPPPRHLLPARRLSSGQKPATTGKLVIVFLQVDLEPSRIAGHLKILPDVEDLLASLHPSDQVAVLSFDSHLKLWQDFSDDRKIALEAIKNSFGLGKLWLRRGRVVSLLDIFDKRAAADVATPEKALQLIGETLAQLPGEKHMIYLGWGLGRYGRGGVRMTPEYLPAVRALDAAQATVFVLDISQADYHSLEVGLQNVAAHTGGTYDRTYPVAPLAVQRLARTLGGHYVVTLDRSEIPGIRGRVTMRLREKKGRILFRPLTLR